MIVIVDYGVGNLGALINMLNFIGYDSCASCDPKIIAEADKLILPGVGSFDIAVQNLRERDLIIPLEDAVMVRKTPVLGVCLGMQLLARCSEEGKLPGLGWIAAQCVKIMPPDNLGLKVPHIGWSDVILRNASPVFRMVAPNSRFYFVHSYHMSCDKEENISAVVDYGGELCCAVSAGNIHGVQFHPEKSHRFGMSLLKSFVECA